MINLEIPQNERSSVYMFKTVGLRFVALSFKMKTEYSNFVIVKLFNWNFLKLYELGTFNPRLPKGGGVVTTPLWIFLAG